MKFKTKRLIVEAYHFGNDKSGMPEWLNAAFLLGFARWYELSRRESVRDCIAIANAEGGEMLANYDDVIVWFGGTRFSVMDEDAFFETFSKVETE